MTRQVETAELQEMRRAVSRALVEIWRGERLIREGVDVTDSQRIHLREVVAEIDSKIRQHENAAAKRGLVPLVFKLPFLFARLSQRTRAPWRETADWPRRGF